MAIRKSRKNNNRAGRLCIHMILIVFVFVMSIQIIKAYHKGQEYAVRQTELEQQLEQETVRKQELEAYEAYTQSQEYIEEVAKSKLGLTYDNEIVFKERK